MKIVKPFKFVAISITLNACSNGRINLPANDKYNNGISDGYVVVRDSVIESVDVCSIPSEMTNKSSYIWISMISISTSYQPYFWLSISDDRGNYSYKGSYKSGLFRIPKGNNLIKVYRNENQYYSDKYIYVSNPKIEDHECFNLTLLVR